MENEIIIVSLIDDQDSCDNQKKLSDNHRAGKGPSSEEAIHCLDTAMKWLEQLTEGDTVQLLSLKRTRDVAAEKRVSALKHKKMLDLFS